jgi:hypothetical protein
MKPNPAMPYGEWPLCVRLVQCEGGTHVTCVPSGVFSVGPTIEGKFIKLQLLAYKNLTSDLVALNLRPMVVEFLHRDTHEDGTEPPDLRVVMDPIGAMRWPSSDVRQLWSQIAHSAGINGHMNLCLASKHISLQIEVCAWHLNSLSKAYGRQAVSVTTRGAFQHGKLADSGYSGEMSIAATAAFTSIATLRDLVAKLVGILMTNDRKEWSSNYASLLKKIKSQNIESDLTNLMLQAESWLKPFSSYRNFLVHRAPLSMIPEIQFVKQIQTSSRKHKFAQVAMQLPLNIDEDGINNLVETDAADFKSWAKRTYDFDRLNAGPDTFTYLHKTLEQLLKISFEVSKHSPVPPIMPVIRGPVTISFN